MSASELVFLPLGGSGEIGMNMNLYGIGPEDDREWIMIDCGVTFGDHTTPGIDLICPDPAYILEYKDNLKALILTHGHEDHIGAVALLAPLLECPVYATPFTAALVRRKLEERGVDLQVLNILDMSARFQIGGFDLEYVTLTHSIPEPCGVVIRTEFGTVLHTGDWKIDPEPTLGPVTDDSVLRALGDEGVLAMVCDSTNVLSKGESGSEARVKEQLIRVVGEQKARVAVTTFASNVGRVVSVCEAAYANDRSVCLIGRSMHRMVDVAREVGMLPGNIKFIDAKEAGHVPERHVLYLCTGSQGEARAALARIARDDHPDLVLNEGDTVLFSSKIIPGNEREIYDLQNALVELGVEIITEKDEFIHVSGHPCQDELRLMYEWARPEIAIPVHGEARHLEAHAEFANALGVKEALAPRNGDLIRLAPAGPLIIDEVPSGRLYLDGEQLVSDGASAMRERRKVSFSGSVTVSIALNKKGKLADAPIVALLGVPEETEDGEDFALILEEAVANTIASLRGSNSEDLIEQAIRKSVRSHINRLWGKRPALGVLIHQVEK